MRRATNSGSAMLKTNPTVLAKVNQDAREVRDSLLGGAEFMLAKEWRRKL